MAKIEKKVSAKIWFKADKMFPNLKKCLEKKSSNNFAMHPAIELETGLLVVTDGHILAAHKLKDYHYEQSENAVIGPMIVLSADVLKMTGTVKVEVVMEGYETNIVATDSTGARCDCLERFRYPRWRTVVPCNTGWPADIDAKAWDDALKQLITKRGNSTFVTELHADDKGQTMDFSHTDDETQAVTSKKATIKPMPYKVSCFVDGRRLRKVMALQPTTMRFTDASRALLFYSEDTLMMLMPILFDIECKVESNCRSNFVLDEWVGNAISKPANEPANGTANGTANDSKDDASNDVNISNTPSERLRAALLGRIRKAA